MWGGMIDVDVVEDASTAELLYMETANAGLENQVAFRQGERYYARLVKKQLPADVTREPAFLRENATYLISGGTGALGREVARWLAEHGARHLVLVSRRGIMPDGALAPLEEAGAEVRICKADISDEQEVRRLLRETLADMPPLDGLFHAAGVLDDSLLATMNPSQLDAVLLPKVKGAWYLHQHTLDQPLSYFVMFSSMASLIGAAGQANYATANAFLDGLSRLRVASGLASISINWGPWRDVGMAAVPESLSRWAKMGVDGIPTGVGLDLLGRLLGQDAGEFAILPIDWQRFVEQFAIVARPEMFERLQTKNTRRDMQQEGEALRKKLAQVPASEQHEVLQEHIRHLISRVSGIEPSELRDGRQPLNEVGIDSNMALEITNYLSQTTGYTLPATLLFNYPSIIAIADHLGDVLIDASGESEAVAEGLTSDEKEARRLAAELEGLSEDTLAAILEDELAGFELDTE
jgi:acyl carrier protein